MPTANPPARIALLPEVVRNQIAAGEVIERPASLVKELVENAIDAGATHIRVELEEGGAQLVRITDNGCGMGAADLALAFEAHATSKLRDPEDLLHIGSLGFRGEALASMGSVARCSILSRPQPTTEGEETAGHKVTCEGGRVSEIREAGAPAGTTVEVRDLFYNTPARRRFMKRPSTELGRCLDAIQRAALAHDGVAFEVFHGGSRVYDVEREMDFLGRIRRTYGAELSEALAPVSYESDGMQLEGYVAPPRFSRRDTTRQLWFLNGRALKDKVLTRILREGYRGFLEEGRQPVAFLRLSLDPERVDVNVHPAKSEVRFREHRRLFGVLVEALRESVATTDMATPGETMMQSRSRRLNREDPRQEFLPNPGSQSAGSGAPIFSSGPRNPSDPVVVRNVPGTPYEIPAPDSGAVQDEGFALGQAGDSAATKESWKTGDDMRGPFLQVARTYLVRALPDGFEIIDQHALHERLTYECMLRDVRDSKVEVQRLLVPELVEIARSDLELLGGHLEALAAIGIELELFGETTIAVQGLPARLRHPDPDGLVRDLIEILGRTGKTPEVQDVIEEVLHSAACRSSIMAGDSLDEGQIRELLERAKAMGMDQTCPHARPTRVRFSLEDLERAFHRR
jgi:DNA mismatch repair protein MutL